MGPLHDACQASTSLCTLISCIAIVITYRMVGLIRFPRLFDWSHAPGGLYCYIARLFRSRNNRV